MDKAAESAGDQWLPPLHPSFSFSLGNAEEACSNTSQIAFLTGSRFLNEKHACKVCKAERGAVTAPWCSHLSLMLPLSPAPMAPTETQRQSLSSLTTFCVWHWDRTSRSGSGRPPSHSWPFWVSLSGSFSDSWPLLADRPPALGPLLFPIHAHSLGITCPLSGSSQ